MSGSSHSHFGRLLIVDDNVHNRLLLCHSLEKQGYQVCEAANGQEALELLEREPVDLVLLDVMMPVMDGLETLRKIREHQSMVQMPVIMVTALNGRQDMVQALEIGANDYLTKPIDIQIALARIRSQLQIRRLTEERSRMLDIGAHDLKKPVLLLQDLFDTLQQDYRPVLQAQAELQDILELARKTTHSLGELVNDFLDMRIVEQGNFQLQLEAHDINELIRDVLPRYEHLAQRKHIALHMDLAPSLPECRADRARLLQVIENLLSNAIKYSPRDTTTVVQTRQEQERILCRICDQGPGLLEHEKEKVFERFTRTRNRPTGGENSSGLGLSICRELIQRQGGAIGVHDNPGGGSTFWFQVPVYSTSAAAR